jgi:hypothetical protein
MSAQTGYEPLGEESPFRHSQHTAQQNQQLQNSVAPAGKEVSVSSLMAKSHHALWLEAGQ